MERARIRLIQGKQREYYEVSLGERSCAFLDEEHAHIYGLLLETLDNIYKAPDSNEGNA
jgi:hypothetical protein